MFSFFDLLKVLGKHIWLITITIVFCTILGAGLSFVSLAPKYISTVELVANTNSQLIGSFKSALTGNTVLEPVSKQLDKKNNYKKYNVALLQKNLSVNANPGISFFSISYTDENANHAINIVNEIADNFSKNANQIFDGTSINVSSHANTAELQSSSKVKFILMGLIGGVILGVFFALVKEWLNPRINTSLDPLKRSGVDYLGKIEAKK